MPVEVGQEGHLFVQSEQFRHHGHGNHLTVAEGRAWPRPVIVWGRHALVEVVHEHLDVGAEVGKVRYHGALSLVPMVVAATPSYLGELLLATPPI